MIVKLILFLVSVNFVLTKTITLHHTRDPSSWNHPDEKSWYKATCTSIPRVQKSENTLDRFG
jgi:hypothetical protein